MEMILKKWGNSLATRIPKAIVDQLNLNLDQKIDIEAKDGKMIITPVTEETEYTLHELLSHCDPDALKLDNEDKAWLNDEPVGREW